MARAEFHPIQKEDVFRRNAEANRGRIDGIEISEAFRPLSEAGLVYWCENCKFCHTDRLYFNVDHLVPDARMRGSSNAANDILNGVLLCTSYEKGARGCNQCKQAQLWPPPGSGLAFTRPGLDMNWLEPHLRGANTHWPS